MAPGSNKQYVVNWNVVSEATSYQLQEATDSAFASATTVYSGTATSVPIASRGIATYYYRVRAWNQNIASVWSSVRSVEVSWEREPNNAYTEATQITSSGQDTYGFPNDEKDYYRFYLPSSGSISVDLSGHTGQSVQLQLFYQTTDHRVVWTPSAPYHLTYNGQAGWYYVYVYSAGGYNNSTPYTLRVTYSSSVAADAIHVTELVTNPLCLSVTPAAP
jgi:hypothetical protein